MRSLKLRNLLKLNERLKKLYLHRIMRLTIAIFLLILTILQNTRSRWIVLYFYAKRDYISQNFCINRFKPVTMCYGKCYLKKQLKETEKKEQKLPSLKFKENLIFIEYDLGIQILKPYASNVLKFLIFNSVISQLEPIFSIFRPPKF